MEIKTHHINGKPCFLITTVVSVEDVKKIGYNTDGIITPVAFDDGRIRVFPEKCIGRTQIVIPLAIANSTGSTSNFLYRVAEKEKEMGWG